MQDISWLQAVKNLGVEITENFLEDVINELEQECARNIKAHQVGIEYDDHTVCAVCQRYVFEFSVTFDKLFGT